MTATEARADVLARLADVPARLAIAVAAADPAPGGGSWPPSWVVHHLVLVEADVWQRRLADIAAASAPVWAWSEPDMGDGPGETPMPELLDAFRRARSTTLATVARLDDAGWARTGRHETFGVLDVVGLLREALAHDEDHLRSLSPR